MILPEKKGSVSMKNAITMNERTMTIKCGSTSVKYLRSEFTKDRIASFLLKSVEEKVLERPLKITFVSDADKLYSKSVDAWVDILTKEIFIRSSLSLPEQLTGLLWELINLSITKKQEKYILDKRLHVTPDQWAEFCLTTEFQTALLFDKILKNIYEWPILNKEKHFYNYTDRSVFFKSQQPAYRSYKKDQVEFLKEQEDTRLIERIRGSTRKDVLTAYVIPFQSSQSSASVPKKCKREPS